MSSDQTTPRDVIVAALRRMSQAGESHEMAARWIMEDLDRAGFPISRRPSEAEFLALKEEAAKTGREQAEAWLKEWDNQHGR